MAGGRVTARKKITPPMVAVRWVDAAMSTDPHWQDGDRPPKPTGKAMHACTTVGFLVHADDGWCQIVASLTDGQHAHVIEIPRQMVAEIVVLTDSGKRI